MKFVYLASVLVAGATLLPAAVISSGSIQISGSAPIGSFNFGGQDFNVTGSFGSGNWGPALCTPCASGSNLSVNGTQVGNDFGGGSAFISPNTFPAVVWGNLNAAGPSIFNITGP